MRTGYASGPGCSSLVPVIGSGCLLLRGCAPGSPWPAQKPQPPTLLSVAGVAAPQDRYKGRPVEPMVGKDLMPLITGEVDRVYEESDSVGYELAGHAALFQGDYKLLFTRGALGDGQWHLYDIVRDPHS